MSKKKKLVIFGSEGRLGQTLIQNLKKDFYIIGVDVKNYTSQTDKFLNSKSINLANVYSQEIYAVIHCQQFKPEQFVSHSILDLDLDFTNSVIEVNLLLSLQSSSEYIKACKKNNYLGRIINVTSTYGIISSNPSLYEGTEMGNPYAYSISKFGLMGLTKYIASYFKEYNVLCNSISPHGIENDQSHDFQVNFSNRSPLGRLSEPEEVIAAFRFLLDEDNTYVNGANIAVDGGWTAC